MSCSSSDAGKYSPEITVSSSNAEDYAVWLTNRLGDKLTDSIYLALGSDASRGIDMTDFENDGYILAHRRRQCDRSRERPRADLTSPCAGMRTRSRRAPRLSSTHRTTRDTASKSLCLAGARYIRIRDRVSRRAQREHALCRLGDAEAHKKGMRRRA